MKDIEEFMQDYEKKANTADFDKVAPLISDDAVFWFSDGSFVGKQAIRGAFEKTWSVLKDEIYSISNLKWLVQEESDAVCIYNFTSESTWDDKRVTFRGRGTSVMKKENGNWLVFHEHLSLEPKKPSS